MEKYYLQSWGHCSLPDDLLAICEDGEEIIRTEWKTRFVTKESGKRKRENYSVDVPTGKFRKVIHLLSEDLVALSERFDLMIQHRGDHRILWLDVKGKRFSVR